MSYLNVTNVSHSFGGRQILENVSFKLLRGEHVGLVGANGEGKSTFLNIVTGHVLPDEGKVEWPGKVTVGYLDQQSTLEKGMTIREVLRTAFDGMYAMEQQMLELYDKMGDASPEELDKMMNTVGEIQSELEHSGFYSSTKLSMLSIIWKIASLPVTAVTTTNSRKCTPSINHRRLQPTSVSNRRLLSWRTSSPAIRHVLLPPIWQKAANASWIRWK